MVVRYGRRCILPAQLSDQRIDALCVAELLRRVIQRCFRGQSSLSRKKMRELSTALKGLAVDVGRAKAETGAYEENRPTVESNLYAAL
jgi:hypothetical protein